MRHDKLSSRDGDRPGWVLVTLWTPEHLEITYKSDQFLEMCGRIIQVFLLFNSLFGTSEEVSAVALDRWSHYTGKIYSKNARAAKMSGHIDRWSDYTGGRIYRFDCTC